MAHQQGHVAVGLGVGEAPPAGRARGYLRIDSVHQGAEGGMKGGYPINAVDCVTQPRTRHAIRAALCDANQDVLPHAPQPLPQLPSALPVRRGHQLMPRGKGKDKAPSNVMTPLEKPPSVARADPNAWPDASAPSSFRLKPLLESTSVC